MKNKFALFVLPLFLGTPFIFPTKIVEKSTSEDSISFVFLNKKYVLNERIRVLPEDCWGGWCQTNEQLDTLCNTFQSVRKRVKIIRQDDGFLPTLGIGLLFQFNPAEIDSFPWETPSAKLQIVDFKFGGARSSSSDRNNYTGLTNDFSSDLKLVVDSFQNNFISGHFSGVLVNGAGGMTSIEEGFFNIRLFEVEN